MLRLCNRKLNFKINAHLSSQFVNSQLLKVSLKQMSGGGHHNSDSEHEHTDHSDHEGHGHHAINPNISENEIYESNARSRIFNNNFEKFSVDKLLDSVKAPLNPEKLKVDKKMDKLFETEKKYVEFLATTFEKKALEKYPNYKQNQAELEKRIKNFDQLNAYQKEVYLLDAYMYHQLEKQENEIRAAYDVSGTTLEQAKQRLSFFEG